MSRYFLAVCFFLGYLFLQGCSGEKESLIKLLDKEYETGRSSIRNAIGQGKKSPSLFVYNASGKLLSWGNNKTPSPEIMPPGTEPVISLPNGLYIRVEEKTADGSLVYLKIIQNRQLGTSSWLRSDEPLEGYYIATGAEAGLDSMTYKGQKLWYSVVPFELSSWKVFNPEYYASSSLNPSLGHLLINILLMGIILVLVERFIIRKIQPGPFQTLSVTLVIFITAWLLTKTIQSIVRDGKINFEFINFTQLNSADIFAQFSIALLLYFFFRVFFASFHILSAKRSFPWIAAGIIAGNTLAILLSDWKPLDTIWFLPLFLLPWLRTISLNRIFSWSYLLTSLILTLGLNIIISVQIREKQGGEQKLIAEKLINREDPVAEFLISEQLRILEKNAPEFASQGEIVAWLNENLFTGYLGRYTTDSLYNPGDYTFRFSEKEFGFTTRYNASGFGFPELFSDLPDFTINKKGFSYAVYSGNELVVNFGNFNYPRSYQVLEKARLEPDAELYQHFHLNDGKQQVVVSYKDRSWVENFANVTYIFILIQIVLLLYMAGDGISLKFSLKQRIQITVVGLVIVAVVLFAGMAHYYIRKEFHDKNRIQLAEKINSVIIELTGKIESPEDLQNNGLKLSALLQKLSSVFFTDITIYDTSGNMVATSQPALFERFILSDKIHPDAFHQLHNKSSNLFVQEENIGNLNYLSAYRPFIDPSNEVIAYINLPYFAKQNELDDQLSVFLVTVINAVVLLLALALAAAIFLSERITTPLKSLQQSMARIELGSDTGSISYDSDDEIGALVKAYNQKLKELAEKVDQLSQTQKEMAWREMAKQVAHEIKNPLTPMKLSAQHLQRTISESDVDLRERVSAFTTGLIEQINTLTKIANEFSNYAQLPKSNPVVYDLNLQISGAVELYQGDSGHRIETHLPDSPVYVEADHNLMLRVINNLLQNAIQAIDKNHKEGRISGGLIKVNLSTGDDKVKLSIADNGTGIPEDIRDSIFMPNFTTRSSGMGLGLAMVKQIVQNSGGRIWFETAINAGSEFFVELPAVHPRSLGPL